MPLPDDEAKTLALSFSAEAHALSHLLRRPLDDLACRLITHGADVLADYIQDALNGAGMDDDLNISSWAEDALKFDMAARRGTLPLSRDNLTAWQDFNITRPEPEAQKRKQRAMAHA